MLSIVRISNQPGMQVAYPKLFLWVGFAVLTLMIASSYWTAQTIEQAIRNSATTSGMNVSAGLANAAAESLIIKDYALLEAVARQTLANNNVLSVLVVNTSDKILLNLKRNSVGSEPKLVFSETKLDRPENHAEKPIYEDTENTLIFWYPINRGARIGWVRLEISKLESKNILSALSLNTLVALFVAFFVVLIFGIWKFRSYLFGIGLLNKDLFAKNIQKEREIISSHLMLMDVLGKMVAKRDSDTGLHNSRVTYIAIRIAEELKQEQGEMQALIAGSFLHDIGKVAIPDAILLKPSGFTEEEWITMKSHVFHGEQLVQNIGWLNIAYEVVAAHHEKWDGTGYPRGLREDSIPISARIFMIADVFDALCSERPYKKAFTYEESMKIIHKDANSHFDPYVVSVFSIISKDIYELLFKRSDVEVEKILKEKIDQFFFSDTKSTIDPLHKTENQSVQF